MIKIEGLTKEFITDKKKPPLVAVNDLTLEVNEGEVFGFLGPNGAGKTTTVRMLCSLIAPTRGRAVVNNYDVVKHGQKVRACVGILTETPGMYERLSADKNLTIFARLYGVKDVPGQVEKYLRMLGLWERRFDEVGSFSKGMRQKLAIARTLLHEPSVIFLDEPTSGLDPEAAHLVRDFIDDLKKEGKTIFLCTHNLDEADRLCQRIGIFKSRLITVDTPDALRQRMFGRTVVFNLASLAPEWTAMVSELPFVTGVKPVDNKLVVDLKDPEAQNPVIIRRLVEAGAEVRFVGELRHSLEDIYLQTINETKG
ncbi:MAG TPA: ABC transporter ATP-binding protein [Anaerolineaceae bacterium]|nr:ABC transporter ATP-binding protein [Anaerolineaceae bacterium]HPN51502.1 ABC transporter ATP-binding protein [Anaerolineaceae bacterium]